MLISIVHPSRSRPKEAFETYKNWNEKKLGAIEYILSIDESDPSLADYNGLFEGLVKIVVSNNHNCVQAVNAGAVHTTGSIIVVVSDDFDCPMSWDLKIFNAMPNFDCILKTDDGAQRWIVTLPIVGRDYYKAKGYIYYPEYQHMFCDTEMTHVADMENKLVFAMGLKFPHLHYSTGKSTKDAINVKADATWNQGEAVYLKRAKNKFGLNIPIDSISIEGGPHLHWLRKKGVK